MGFYLICWTPICGKYFWGALFWKKKKYIYMEKRPFFRAAMAGLGKCCTGGYGRIRVYRVKVGATLYGLGTTQELMVESS